MYLLLSIKLVLNLNQLKFIGPGNLHENFVELEKQKARQEDILQSVQAAFGVVPMTKDLDINHMSREDLFNILLKREIAWSYSDFNEFGLLSCEELGFNMVHKTTDPTTDTERENKIELTSDRNLHVIKYDNAAEYLKASVGAKDLQTKCLIKSLEKSPITSTQPTCTKDIPFCFTDTKMEVWFRVD